MNILKNTKVYLAGGIQYVDGETWRDKITVSLNQLGIHVLNPLKSPFLNSPEESKNTQAELTEEMEKGNLEYVSMRMKSIRNFDLACVDRSDMVIVNIDPKIASWGTAEELKLSLSLRKPTFLAINGGKTKCPLWITAMLPHKYIYNNIDEVVEVLQKIDSVEKEMDSSRWRLLRNEFR